jgi:glycosyltransferase involved in cell wall biosynthesis
LGAALCAQRAIDEAKGEYLVRLDADDRCAPNRINKQVTYMDAHPEIGASGGFLQLFGDQDKVWEYPEHNDDCKAKLLFGVPVSQGASILRRSVIREHGIRYADDLPPFGEDWLYWLEWSKVSRFGNLQENLTFYRRGAHNASFGRNKYEDLKLLFRRIFAFYNIPLSDDDLELHLYTIKIFNKVITSESLNAFRRHLDLLLNTNEDTNKFPQWAFADRIDLCWRELFYYLPAYGKKVVNEYSKLSSGLNDQERKYYFRSRVNKLLGRT